MPDKRTKGTNCGYEPFFTAQIRSGKYCSYGRDFYNQKLKDNSREKRYSHHIVSAFEYRYERVVFVVHTKHMEKFAESKRSKRHRLRLTEYFGITVV